MHEIKTKKVLGLNISIFTKSSLIESIKNFIKSKEQKVFFGYSLVILPKFRDSPEIFIYSDKFDIFLADGKGMYWLFRLAGAPLKSDMSLPDLADLVLTMANQNAYSVMLIGAEEEINDSATKKIRSNYPNAIIFDGINGYFKQEEESIVVEKINLASPDILLIGISSPTKERFVNDWRSKLNATIIIPCGGVIDVLAEKTKREPLIIKKSGFTWIYRFLQEPKRLFKPIFVNGLNVIFFLLPAILFNLLIKKDKTFSIPKYYGISNNN